ncbi:MAG: Uma2 family endonuclease [Solirubrobacteraceae bacterium]
MAVEVSLPPIPIHRFSLQEYHQLIESGGFDEDSRVELIEGVIADMSPKTPEHERVIAWLARWLMLAVDAKEFEVRICAPLTLEISEPEPDLMVFQLDAPQPYHPATAALVIEVAVSSQVRDLRLKPPLYARAEVTEYWVVDVDGNRAVVHRQPVAGRYTDVSEVPAEGQIIAQALSLPVLSVAELLAGARG